MLWYVVLFEMAKMYNTKSQSVISDYNCVYFDLKYVLTCHHIDQ